MTMPTQTDDDIEQRHARDIVQADGHSHNAQLGHKS